jgi:alpha-N-acetylglucosaminidase
MFYFYDIPMSFMRRITSAAIIGLLCLSLKSVHAQTQHLTHRSSTGKTQEDNVISPKEEAVRQDIQIKAVRELMGRLIGAHAADVDLAFIPKSGGKDVFELETVAHKIMLRGSSGVALASALNYYLKNYTHCDIGWNGTNLNLPAALPLVETKIRKETPYDYRYYLNYCTFNYSMSWWNWDRWQWEIDWMALNGINMPLALTGQNVIWDRVYKSLGFTDEDLKGFFSGPAYFNWFWMGNLDGWGGPLPQRWMQDHEALQHQILARERELGMTPVLPAFTGHVPPAFTARYPNAKLRKTNWGTGFSDVYILDPNDPMFTEIGNRFIKEEIKTYGTDHLYSADTFNENTPPSNDSSFLNDVSKKVYRAMAAVDPKATWVMQGWLFVNGSWFWKPTQIKALLNAVPNDHMIILDLWAETNPDWNKTQGFYGKPWIWCMLHNFGGNIGMFGRMKTIATAPVGALHDPHAGSLLGIGLTPEGIEQNPALYELMLDNTWRTDPIDLDAWLKDYSFRRYGKADSDAQKAWTILQNTVYNPGPKLTDAPESIISGRPTFQKSTDWTQTGGVSYQPWQLREAWTDLVQSAPSLKGSDGYQYDLVDLTRQVLSEYADSLQQACAQAYQQKDVTLLRYRSQLFLELLGDMDLLLGTRKDFLLGRWLNSARSWGTNPEESDLYEKNARDLITLWGDKNSPLTEYACKQWSGLINGYYKPRWSKFFAEVIDSLQEHKPMDEKAFGIRIRDWEWAWVNGHEAYADQPIGDPVDVSLKLYHKYMDVFASGSPHQISLWASGAPGFEQLKDQPEQAQDYWVKNIHNPSITAYLAPKDKANGTAVLICPGGGHRLLVYNAEGRDAALYLNSLGISAFVLKYRLFREDSIYTLQKDVKADVYRAMRLIRSQASAFGIDPNRLGIMGFSAGGEVAALVAYGSGLSDPSAADPVDRFSAKPNFQMLIYPGPLGIPDVVPSDAPPSFLVAADDDTCCSGSIIRLLSAYRAAKVPVEAHLYAKGSHGFNMGYRSDLYSIQGWPARMADWLRDNQWLGTAHLK